MYQASAIKTKTYPTIAEAIAALKKADNPDDDKKDTRDLMSILMRMTEFSPRLRGHLLTRRTAVTAFDWHIAPFDNSDAQNATDVAQRLNTTIRRTLGVHPRTPGFGCLLVQLLWSLIDGKWKPFIVRRYQPVELERRGPDLDKLAIVTDANPSQKTAVDTLDPHDFIIDVDDDSTLPGGILRSLIFHEILRSETLIEWANFNRKVKGVILGQYNEFAEPEDIETGVLTLKQLTQNNFSVTSDKIKFSFEKMVDQIGAQSFNQFKEALEADASIALLGQANTSELPDHGGSRSALEVLNLIRADIHYSDIVRCEEMINSQLLLSDFQLNFDKTATDVPWKFKFVMSQEQDTEKNARTITELLTAGVPLIQSEVYDQTGFTVPKEGDTLITPQPKTAVPF